MSILSVQKKRVERDITENNKAADKARQEAIQAELERSEAEAVLKAAEKQFREALRRSEQQKISLEEALIAVQAEAGKQKDAENVCSCKKVHPLRYRIPDTIKLQLYKKR